MDSASTFSTIRHASDDIDDMHPSLSLQCRIRIVMLSDSATIIVDVDESYGRARMAS